MRPLAAFILILTSCAAALAAPAKAPRPTQATDAKSCVTPECHAAVKDYKVLHGPVNLGTCDACHELADAKAHTFKLARQNAEICTFCHDFSTGKAPVVHKPVARGECLGCHDPHGGRNHSLTRGDSTAELCARCHDNVMRDKKFVHSPVAAGECDSCHQSHASRYPKLLDAQGSDLCLDCHKPFAARLARARFTHKAMDEGCSKCHDAHGSNYAMETTAPVVQLCTASCHEKVKNDAAQAKFKHSVELADRACLVCHTSHGGDMTYLMRDLPSKACMECHTQDLKIDKDHTIAGIPEVNDEKAFKHGPIREGQCNGCHSAHAADRPQRLVKAYARSFYQAFSMESYELCFSCHDAQMVRQEKTAGLTAFRNGEQNLHSIHMLKGERGRSCRVCHSTHAGANDRNVRDWVQFGKWQLPISFTRTPTGGTCASGCHPPYSYDREKPVPAVAGPATRQSPRITLPEADRVVMVRWSGKDAAGGNLSVPDPARPTVMLFLRPQPGQDGRDVLRLVSSAVRKPESAQVVLVLTGPQAVAEAKAMAAAKTPPWPIIVDADYALSGRYAVHAWPTSFVIQSDGTLAAHLNGAPPSLAIELEAYIDAAAKRIDEAVLRKRLGGRETVSEDPARKAAWQAQAAEKLLDEGKNEEARQLTETALLQQPDSAPLRLAMARALIQVQRPREAVPILDSLPAGAASQDRVDLLRSTALVAMNRWREARDLTAKLLARSPGLADAHYLMGSICEHDKDWPKAAAEYRAAHGGRP